MKRKILDVDERLYNLVPDFVKQVFTDSEGEESGELVKNLVNEIRESKYYVPKLDLVMVNEHNEIIGFCLFSRFHIEGKYDDKLLLLSPVAVKTNLQRQHISKELIEYGLKQAKELGYTMCMVEGNPLNYHSRGFKTSAEYNIFADESVGLPAKECLMIQELVEGALDGVSGYINYDIYKSLK